MSLQQDKPLDLHKTSQWNQYPPPYPGHQWTCNLCKSTFGSLEQREIHQQECSARNRSAQQPQFSTTVSSRSGYAPRMESAEVFPYVSHPPNPMMNLQRMPGNTRPHLAPPVPPQVPTGKQAICPLILLISCCSRQKKSGAALGEGESDPGLGGDLHRRY